LWANLIDINNPLECACCASQHPFFENEESASSGACTETVGGQTPPGIRVDQSVFAAEQFFQGLPSISGVLERQNDGRHAFPDELQPVRGSASAPLLGGIHERRPLFRPYLSVSTQDSGSRSARESAGDSDQQNAKSRNEAVVVPLQAERVTSEEIRFAEAIYAAVGEGGATASPHVGDVARCDVAKASAEPSPTVRTVESRQEQETGNAQQRPWNGFRCGILNAFVGSRDFVELMARGIRGPRGLCDDGRDSVLFPERLLDHAWPPETDALPAAKSSGEPMGRHRDRAQRRTASAEDSIEGRVFDERSNSVAVEPAEDELSHEASSQLPSAALSTPAPAEYNLARAGKAVFLSAAAIREEMRAGVAPTRLWAEQEPEVEPLNGAQPAANLRPAEGHAAEPAEPEIFGHVRRPAGRNGGGAGPSFQMYPASARSAETVASHDFGDEPEEQPLAPRNRSRVNVGDRVRIHRVPWDMDLHNGDAGTVERAAAGKDQWVVKLDKMGQERVLSARNLLQWEYYMNL